MSSRHEAYMPTVPKAAVRPRGAVGRAHQRTPWLLLALSDVAALTAAVEITRLTASRGADLATPAPGTVFLFAAIAGPRWFAGARLYGSTDRPGAAARRGRDDRLMVLGLAARTRW